MNRRKLFAFFVFEIVPSIATHLCHLGNDTWRMMHHVEHHLTQLSQVIWRKSFYFGERSVMKWWVLYITLRLHDLFSGWSNYNHELKLVCGSYIWALLRLIEFQSWIQVFNLPLLVWRLLHNNAGTKGFFDIVVFFFLQKLKKENTKLLMQLGGKNRTRVKF